MRLSKRDKEFRLPKISYLDFKQLEMDRVLTAFFARLKHDGVPSRLRRTVEVTSDAFVAEFLEHPEWFDGFDRYPDILRSWIETHLMDMVNRGKAKQAIAAPRPLHGYTYRFRNPKRSRDYGASQQVYETLYHARQGQGYKSIDQLKRFFFPGIDLNTDKYDASVEIDVETQALLRLSDQVKSDAPDPGPRDSFPPVCLGAADLMADDVIRLLVYQSFIPRSVMVDYLKILLSFHLSLYHLRLFKLLPILLRRRSADPTCAVSACPMSPRKLDDPHGGCPYRIYMLVDVANSPDTQMANLAEASAEVHYRRIIGFVSSYFTLKKLDEFAENLVKRGKLVRPDRGFFDIGDLVQLLEPVQKQEREAFFKMRLAGLLEDTSGDRQEDLPPEIQAVLEMKLPDLETYIESIVALRGRFHRQYITECLDSLLLKNRPGALLAQPRVRNASRRFVLDSRLLEVLLQIAVLRPGGTRGFYTEEMRIETLLAFLRERYGIYVDRLPPGDGFGEATMIEREALRKNLTAFMNRLREVGFYRDLSDAYISQTVTPRYTIAKTGSPEAVQGDTP